MRVLKLNDSLILWGEQVQGRIYDFEKGGGVGVEGPTPNIFLAYLRQFMGLFKELGAKRNGRARVPMHLPGNNWPGALHRPVLESGNIDLLTSGEYWTVIPHDLTPGEYQARFRIHVIVIGQVGRIN